MLSYLEACTWVANNDREFSAGLPRCSAQLVSIKLVAEIYNTDEAQVVARVASIKEGQERVARAFRGESP